MQHIVLSTVSVSVLAATRTWRAGRNGRVLLVAEFEGQRTRPECYQAWKSIL